MDTGGLLHLCIVVLLLTVCSVFGDNDRYLQWLRTHLSDNRHPLVGSLAWSQARYFVKNEMLATGLEVELQTYNTTVMEDRHTSRRVEGMNVIGVLPGDNWGSSKDRILVLAAHHDTDVYTKGIYDDGSGVVVLLETARRIVDATLVHETHRLHMSVVFASFDTQTREHSWSPPEGSLTGSDVFVRDWLSPLLSGDRSVDSMSSEFRGAIVLDSVGNFNASIGSQTLPSGYDKTFPVSYSTIHTSNYLGNYLCLVLRDNPHDSFLARTLSSSWSASGGLSCRLEELKLGTNSQSVTDAYLELTRQDHISFWNRVPLGGGDPDPLSALVITDTGKWRGVPCSGDHCDVTDYMTSDRLKLLDKLAASLTSFTLELQAEEVEKQPNSSSRPAILLLPLLSSLVWIILVART